MKKKIEIVSLTQSLYPLNACSSNQSVLYLYINSSLRGDFSAVIDFSRKTTNNEFKNKINVCVVKF